MSAPVGGGREGVKLRPRALHADCELQVRTELHYLIKFKHSVGVGVKSRPVVQKQTADFAIYT